MTRDVQNVIASAKARGIDDVDVFEASTFLLAKKILLRNPHDVQARKTVEAFAEHLRTGEPPSTFAPFMLREP